MNEMSQQDQEHWATLKVAAEGVLGPDLCELIGAHFAEKVDQPEHRETGYTGIAHWLEEMEEGAYDVKVQVTVRRTDTSPGNTALLKLVQKVDAAIADGTLKGPEKQETLLDLNSDICAFKAAIEAQPEALGYLKERVIALNEKLLKEGFGIEV